MKQMSILRGDIIWVDLEPAIGSETKKKRPALVISNDLININNKVIIIAPITSNTTKVYPFEHKIALNDKIQGKIMFDQMKAVDKKRLGKKIASLPLDEIRQVDEIIKHVTGVQ